MLEGGADLRVIQQMLGHARAETTAIYAAVDIAHLREVYQQSHPAALAKIPAPDKPQEEV